MASLVLLGRAAAAGAVLRRSVLDSPTRRVSPQQQQPRRSQPTGVCVDSSSPSLDSDHATDCLASEPSTVASPPPPLASSDRNAFGPSPLTRQAKLLLQTFAELELSPIQESVGGVRVRQHVNPLKARLVAPLAPVKWESVFADCSLPLMVDIGSGSGRFVMVLAKRNAGSQNYIGLDVRERLVDRAKLWAEELQLGNLHFLTTNATVAFDSLLSSYPGPLAFVSILCPDPHFKRKYRKRRIVQKQLVDAILNHLQPGGGIFVQSDVEDVALDMRGLFDEHLGSSLVAPGVGGNGDLVRDCQGWVEENPLGVPSEREAQVLATGGRVYRAVYRKL